MTEHQPEVSHAGHAVSASPAAVHPIRVRTSHHELILYADSAPFFEALEELVRSARDRVWIETYIYRDDELGRPFGDLLLSAVARGLDVRLLYDPQGSRGASRGFFDVLRAGGVSVRAYRPWRLGPRRWKYFPRDHGRIIIVDDTAHTGGINFGVEWLSRARGGGDWHDVAAGVRGPRVSAFEAVFARRWAEADAFDDVVDYASGDDHSDVEFIADTPNHEPIILGKLCSRIQQATTRVWIEIAYCVPPRVLLEALEAAAKRGVDVQLLMPALTDLPSIQTVTRGEYPDLLRRGLRIFEYQPKVMHSKFVLVDDDWGTVGSFNAISPGVWWANETNIVVHDGPFIAELARVFENDVAQSQPITGTWTARRAWPSRAWELCLARAYRAAEWITTHIRRGRAAH
jgi:cardiolipin synthase